MNLNKISSSFISLGGMAFGVSLVSKCIYKVEPGERAIIFDKFGGGMKSNVYGEGFHFYWPLK